MGGGGGREGPVVQQVAGNRQCRELVVQCVCVWGGGGGGLTLRNMLHGHG